MHKTLRHGTRFIAVGFLVATAGSGLNASSALAVTSGTAARAGASTQAAPPECEPGAVKYVITSKKKKWVITHATGYSVAKGVTITDEKKAEYVTKLSSSVAVEGALEVSTGGLTKIIAGAKVSTKASLAKLKEHTSTKTQSISVTMKGGKKQRHYAVYKGYRKWSGGWRMDKCNSRGQIKKGVTYGTWKSYSSTNTGAALCPAKNYKKGTLDYNACKATWS